MIPGIVAGGANGEGSTYSHWNPADQQSGVTTLDSNKVANGGGSIDGSKGIRSVTNKNAGKWRIEMVPIIYSLSNGSHGFGFAVSGSFGTYPGSNTTAWILWGNYGGDVRVYHNGSASSWTLNIAADDVISLIIDIDAGKAWWAKNGTVISGDPVAGTGAMATAAIYLACSPAVALTQIRLRTNPTEMTAASVSGFTDGWPD